MEQGLFVFVLLLSFAVVVVPVYLLYRFVRYLKRRHPSLNRPIVPSGPGRQCFVCSYEGPMKTWLSNHTFPLLASIVLLSAAVVPGLLFIAWGWGKHKCPRCGALAKSAPIAEVQGT